MSPMAIILVSAQISPNHYEISAHHATEAGEQRANATVRDLIPYSKQVGLRRVELKPIIQG